MDERTTLGSAASQDPFLGTVLDQRYEVVSVLGAGGMGTVYRARHLALNRLVAVKIMHPQLAVDRKTIQRFEQEARAMSALSHPHLISIQDVGLTKFNTPYLVMEYLECRSLAELLDSDAQMETGRASILLSQIADGLSHAHEKGIVHRDLKPANILVVGSRNREFIKIVDLGIAKLLAPDDSQTQARLTQTGEVFGSPSYMSPEQCTGAPQDYRVDIYAFGCVIYEMLTGRPPFRKSGVLAVINSHINETPPRFIDVNPALAMTPQMQRLEQLAYACIAKKPGDRPDSMDEIASYLSSQEHLSSDTTTEVSAPIARSNRTSITSITASDSSDDLDDEETKLTQRSARRTPRKRAVAARATEESEEKKPGLLGLETRTQEKLIVAGACLIGLTICLTFGTVIIDKFRSTPSTPQAGSNQSSSIQVGNGVFMGNGNTASSISELANQTPEQQFKFWAEQEATKPPLKIKYPPPKDDGAEMRLYGVYRGFPRPDQTMENLEGDVTVNVKEEDKPLILVLNSYAMTTWHIKRASSRVKIEKILLVGYQPQAIEGAKDAKVEKSWYVYLNEDGSSSDTRTHKNFIEPASFTYQSDDRLDEQKSFQKFKSGLEEYTGRPLTLVEGRYIGRTFDVD